jgi:chromosome segregation ATPase
MKNNRLTDMTITHYTNVVLAIAAGAGYLLLSNVDNLQPPEFQKVNVKAGYGITMLFVSAGLAILTFLHYLFVKRFTNLDTMHTFGLGLMTKHLFGVKSGETVTVEVTTTIEELRRELEIKSYEISELSTKLTKSHESLRRLEDANRELRIEHTVTEETTGLREALLKGGEEIRNQEDIISQLRGERELAEEQVRDLQGQVGKLTDNLAKRLETHDKYTTLTEKISKLERDVTDKD